MVVQAVLAKKIAKGTRVFIIIPRLCGTIAVRSMNAIPETPAWR
jgi:hypothetical protein